MTDPIRGSDEEGFACEIVPPEQRARVEDVEGGTYAEIVTEQLPNGAWRATAGPPVNLAYDGPSEMAAKVGLVKLFASQHRSE